ncbi:hypothetical protein [Bradyrhizobium brasilense]|uniref:hypothetical protein n=1 Tax=Bradyrhizobium brasilense TaxID=1419277 RepID=UPI0014572D55|nr:hypothetical protein [Bradyrhizobium brasilense]
MNNNHDTRRLSSPAAADSWVPSNFSAVSILASSERLDFGSLVRAETGFEPRR